MRCGGGPDEPPALQAERAALHPESSPFEADSPSTIRTTTKGKPVSNTKPIVDWRQLSRLERKITADEFGAVMDRWGYGREVLKAKAGRKQLPDGMIADLIKAAERTGKKISEREIQYRVKLATIYATDQQVRKAIADLGSWTEIIRAGFPEVTVDEEPVEANEAEEPEFEQLSLIPGLGSTLKVGGREIALAEATIADIKKYRETFARIHEAYEKKLAQIDNALAFMADATDDDTANALDAWKRGIST